MTSVVVILFFFFNDTATTEIYTYGHTLSLHDALPIYFVQECSQRWGVLVTWTEFRAAAPFFAEEGYQGASRNGEPFDALIDKKQYLPNQHSRFCTQELQIRPAKRYLRPTAWDRVHAAMTTRPDQPTRALTLLHTGTT